VERLPPGIAFRPLRRDDLPLLQRWLALPHIDAWWHQPLDRDGLEATYGPRIDGTEPTHVFVIEYRGRTIGWIQWYRWADYPDHAARLGAELDTAGIDLAIGELDLIGRGLGALAIGAFLERVVFVDPAITGCVCDPETRNRRSIRAFEKAGFTRERTVRLPGESVTREVVRCPATNAARRPR
jgi:RimJ/RimL family protein N-acetyltransferase